MTFKKGKYSAMDVAAECIYFCSEELKSPISNLKLQKLLYYIQGAFLSQTDEPCFKEPIVAWKYGPVVEDVYYELRQFGSDNMSLAASPEIIDDEDLEIIYEVCRDNSACNALALAQKTHGESPWKETNQGETIPLNKIEEFFKTKNSEALEINV